MGQQEYDNFKRLIKEWLDNHPDEYADFVEEMNGITASLKCPASNMDVRNGS